MPPPPLSASIGTTGLQPICPKPHLSRFGALRAGSHTFAPPTFGHMIGHLLAVPLFGSVLWGPSSLIYLIAGGRRLRRTSLQAAEA